MAVAGIHTVLLKAFSLNSFLKSEVFDASPWRLSERHCDTMEFAGLFQANFYTVNHLAFSNLPHLQYPACFYDDAKIVAPAKTLSQPIMPAVKCHCYFCSMLFGENFGGALVHTFACVLVNYKGGERHFVKVFMVWQEFRKLAKKQSSVIFRANAWNIHMLKSNVTIQHQKISELK